MSAGQENSVGPQAGQAIGAWTLLEPLGAGAFGTTWRARRGDGRIGALKVLSEPPGEELRALSTVCHPAVVEALDAGSAPVPYLVMDLAPGASLGAVLAREGPNPAAAPELAAVLADALAAVHAVGIAHGDVKPDNVIVGSSGRAWLVDFGMAGRQGGTPLYAAPERSVGGTPRGDVYALGLVVWELLHGGLPWGTGWGDRGTRAPVPRVGPAWLRDLVVRMLDPKPERRPTAAEIADALAANGQALPAVDSELLRRRAARSQVPRGALDQALSSWLDGGGSLAVVGSPGSGRSHTLARLAVELSARGERWIQWVPGPRAWDAVREALADPRLGPPRPLPADETVEMRARLAAAELADRADGPLFVLADDAHTLDEASRATLRVLVESGRVHVCLADVEPPPWVPRSVALAPLDEAGVAALVGAILGPSAETGPLVAAVVRASDGVPGRAVDFLRGALEAGALVRRAQRWLVDDARVAALAAEAPAPAPLSLDAEVAAVAAPIGLAGAIPLRALAELAGVDAAGVEVALHALAGLGLVALDVDLARPAGRAAASTLAAHAPNPQAVHRRLVDWLLAQEAPPLDRLGWHLVGAGEVLLAARHGPQAVRAAMAVDPADAARMAGELAALASSPALAAARVEALRAAGQIERALEVGEQALQGPDQWEVLVALGKLHASFRDDPGSALACFARARQVAPVPLPLEIDRAEAEALLRAGRNEEARRLASEALADLPETRGAADHGHQFALHTVLAQAVDRVEGPAAALEVLASVQPSSDTREAAMLESTRGHLLFRTGRLHDGARAMEAAAKCEALSAGVRARLMSNAAGAQFHIGSLRSALASWEQCALLLERMDARADLAGTLTNMALAYEELGRPERALDAARRAVDLALAAQVPAMAAAALGNLGDLLVARGEDDEALEVWARARAQAERAGNTSELIELQRRRAQLATLRRESGALELAQAARSAALEAGNTIEACRAGALVAIGEALAGRRRRVELLLDLVTQPLQEAGASAALADVRLHLAMALIAVGDAPGAREQVERALTYAEEVGSVTLRTRADALIASLGPTEAVGDPRLDRLLDIAVDVARQRDLGTLLDSIASAALDLLGAERSFVLLVEAHGPVVAAQRATIRGLGGPPAMTIVRRALSGRREVIAGDLGERGDLRAAASVMQLDLRSVLCVPMLEAGEAIGAIYVDSRHVTEREWVSAARLLRALAAHAAVAVANARYYHAARERAELAADIAHDLSGPAHVVLCIADELQEDDFDLLQVATDLRLVGQHIVAMRDRFLGGGAAHHGQRVALDAWLDELSTQLARIARRDGVVLEVRIDDAVTLDADTHELERALTNLVRNAVRFSPAAGRVVISLHRDGEWAVIEVSDEGPGVPAELVDSIFERGVQGSADGTGHGLGLSIARRVALAHNGRIACRNCPEGGAVFSLSLPL